VNIIVVGTAGSGKSTFTLNFSDYLRRKGYLVGTVNLDPASPPIYQTEWDIRKFVKAEEVMEQFNLGVNGALLKSVEIAQQHITKLIPDAEYVIIDTPGQMELFLYSNFGENVVESLNGFSTCIFIVDSTRVSTPENFISIIAQSAVVSLRLSIPTLTVFNKCDITEIPDLNEVKRRIGEEEGVLAELMEKLVEFVEYTTLPYRLIRMSSITSAGFDDVFSALNELFCACGDIS
jgi:hypothetical protein